MLYTGKGDDGMTQLYGCDQRMSKSAATAEALGAVDETNTFLGVLKLKGKTTMVCDGLSFYDILSDTQHDLFIVQAELAGANKKIEQAHIEKIEQRIVSVSKDLPPIKNFSIPGGTEISASLDYARTLIRRAERRVVAALEEQGRAMTPSVAYLNRLSSFLFALARLANHREGISEEKPHY